MQIEEVAHFSRKYMQTVALRYAILRKPLGLDFSTEQLAAEDTDYHLAAYEYNEILSACLVLTPVNTDVIKMRQVAVSENMQGKGMGTALVKFSEKFCAEKGFKEIILHARDTAVPFYLRMNYQIFDEPFEEVSIPHRKMRKMVG